MTSIEKIKKKALEEHIPIIMDDTLEVVDQILKEVKPQRILEIGTAVGYSAMCFSEYLQEGGKIDTIERDEERIAEALDINLLKVEYLVRKVTSILWKRIIKNNEIIGTPSSEAEKNHLLNAYDIGRIIIENNMFK